MAASVDFMRCMHTLVPIQSGVMWLEAWQPVTFVKLAIYHHLIDIALRDALFGIIDAGCDPLPLCVDDLHDLVAVLQQDVRPRLEQTATIVGFEAIKSPALADDTEI